MSEAEGGRSKAEVDRLMAEGLRNFREGRTDDAALAFRRAAELNPENEFAWIWVAQTSSNPNDQRRALEQALVANPNSKYANDALRRLNLSMGAQPTAQIPVQDANPPVGSAENIPVTPGSTGGRVSFPVEAPPPQPPVAPPPDLRNAPTPSFDELRSTLVGGQNQPQGRRDRRGNKAQPAPTRASAASRRNAAPAAANRKMRRGGANVLLRFLLALLLVAVLVAIFLALLTFLNNNNGSPIAVVPTGTAAPATTASTLGQTASVSVAATDTPLPLPTNTPLPSPTPSPTNTPLPTATLSAALAANTAAVNAAAVSAQVAQLYNNALALSNQGKDADAAAQLEQGLALDRNNATLQYQLGLAYLRLARSAPAPSASPVATGTPGTATTSTQTPVPNISGNTALDKAVAAFQRVTALRPSWPGGYLQLAQALALRGDLPAAITALQSSLALDSNGPDRWLLLADLYERNNQPNEAAYARGRAGVATITPGVPPGAITTAPAH